MDYLIPVGVAIVLGPLSLITMIRATMPKAPKTPEAMKEVVMNFVKQGYLLIRMNRKPKPGESMHNFQSALGLCYETYDPDRLTVSKNFLSYRYKLAPSDKLTPGLGTALMDEVTAGLMGAAGKPAGASLFFQTQWYPENIKSSTSADDDDEDYLDIINTLTKNGRTISHTRTDIRSSDNKLIGYSTHVKYMPFGNIMMDTLISYFPMWMSPWVSGIINKQLPPPSPTAHENIGAHKAVDSGLKIVSDGKGEFSMTDDHKNPFGTLHGGCTAMIMEKVGESYANSLFKDSKFYLESLQVQFLSAGRGQKILTIESETIEFTENNHALIRVKLMKPNSGKKKGPTVLAEGTLRYLVK
ncbi:unnamed protein product [Cylindrotheca closterium]|uniref:Thioesterase domain-containing protein n=1 Tax=Cylindrotheca closterium TaxID=2856 RepID=A0AAD2CR25_9STRA|nr:unnamed protein product [Cylindrotheca closterium]